GARGRPPGDRLGGTDRGGTLTKRLPGNRPPRTPGTREGISSAFHTGRKSAPVSSVRGEPPELSSIFVSASEAVVSRRFVLGLAPLESQAGRDLVPRFDRVAELPCQIDHIQHCWPT